MLHRAVLPCVTEWEDYRAGLATADCHYFSFSVFGVFFSLEVRQHGAICCGLMLYVVTQGWVHVCPGKWGRAPATVPRWNTAEAPKSHCCKTVAALLVASCGWEAALDGSQLLLTSQLSESPDTLLLRPFTHRTMTLLMPCLLWTGIPYATTELREDTGAMAWQDKCPSPQRGGVQARRSSAGEGKGQGGLESQSE